MPSIPKTLKMFFCRVTRPYNQDVADSMISRKFIQTKFYKHDFEVIAFCHEVGNKTEKPHYHILYICKTTKSEIAKLLKDIFSIDNCAGNKDFSVSDKYPPASFKISLAYMYKGGANKDRFHCATKKLPELFTIEDLIEIYESNNCFMKLSVQQKKFKYYYELIKSKIPPGPYNYAHYEKDELFSRIYSILLMDAKMRNVFFRFNIIAEQTRVLVFHFKDDTLNYYVNVATNKEYPDDKFIKNI